MDEKLTGEEVVYFGNAVKATQLDDGSVKLGGYLVTFGDEENTDLVGDFFTKNTDFGELDQSDVYFNHRLPLRADGVEIDYKAKLSRARLSKDDVGVFAETILKARNKYEQAIIDAGMAGKLGWSSGTAGHLVEREPVGKAWKITAWSLGLDASLTPTPAEPKNTVVPLKSISEAVVADKGKESEVKHAAQSAKENLEMELNDIKALFDEQANSIKTLVKEEAATAAKAAVTEVLDNLPEVKAKMNGDVKVTKDEADQPFKSNGEFFQAVKNVAFGSMDPRLIPLKATGLNEAQPSQAGFLVPQQTAAGIIEKMYGTGTLLSLFSNRDTVSGNNMSYNLVDETSRANGSRFGGLQAYWLNEGGTFTASKPKFRQLELKLKKVTALCVATDELLSDASALGSWLSRTVPEELRFKVEDAIINGDGVGKPSGILTHGALKSVTRTDANEIDALDLGRMWAGRWAGVSDYVFLGNQGIFPQLLTLTIGTQPVFLPAGGLSGLPYATLLGRPYYDIEYAPALGTVGDLMLVSPSQYQMIEKGGIDTATSIHVYFTTEEQAFRFSYRVDGAPTWNSTLTGFDGQTYSPFVTLAATT